MSNTQKLGDIREACEEIKALIQEGEIGGIPDLYEIMEMVRQIKSITHYISDSPQIVAFERCDDGEIFTLNADGATYSNHQSKLQFPDNLHHEYTAKELINTDFFKPILK